MLTLGLLEPTIQVFSTSQRLNKLCSEAIALNLKGNASLLNIIF